MESDQSPYLTTHPPYLDEALLQLASGKPYNAAVFDAVSISFGWSAKDAFVCACVIAPQDQSIGSVDHACMRLENLFKGSCVLPNGSNILMLVNLSTAGLSRDQVISSLLYLQREYVMKIGYSYEFQGIENLRLYYLQASLALELGQKFDSHIWIYRFETYTLRYALLNSLETLNAIQLCHPGLIKLLNYDKEKNRNFAHTLRVYLENNMSVTHAMKKEHLQRASFQYRLQKIQEIMHVNLDLYETRLHLLLSFQWLDLENGIK